MKSQKFGRSKASLRSLGGNTTVTVSRKLDSYSTKTTATELTDEEIKNVIPEGCAVFHKKYGMGTVKAILEGKVDVLFEGSVEKVFAASLCIDKQLLTLKEPEDS